MISAHEELEIYPTRINGIDTGRYRLLTDHGIVNLPGKGGRTTIAAAKKAMKMLDAGGSIEEARHAVS